MSRIVRLLLVGGLVIWLGLQVARAAGAAPDDTATVNAGFKQAWMALDVDRLASYLSDDAIITDPAFGTFHGPAEFRAFVQGFMQQNPGLSVSWSESAVVLDTAVYRGFFASDAIRTTRASRVVEIDTMVVSQGKVIAVVGQLDLSDADTARFVAALGGK
jgi:hypothetical protein